MSIRRICLRSQKKFEELKRQGILTFVQPDLHHETYHCSIACSNTCPMEVVDEDGKLFAICPEDTEIDPIPLTKDDLSRYAFCLDTFLDQIRIANKIGGKCQRLGEHHIYMGYKIYDGERVGIVFVFDLGNSDLLTCSGLKQVCREDNILVVLKPAFQIEDVFLKEKLRQDKIIQMPLASFVTFESFELPIDELVLGRLIPALGRNIAKVESKSPEQLVAHIKKGDMWEFDFGGKKAHVQSKLKGLVLVEYLLLHPNKEYTPQELLRESGQRPKQIVVSKEWVKQLSNSDIKTINKAKNKLKDDMQDTEDITEKSRIQQKIKFIDDYLRQSTNIQGKPRAFSEKERASVTRNIKTVLGEILPQHRELHNHLDMFLRRGVICSYRPDKEIVWNISQKTP